MRRTRWAVLVLFCAACESTEPAVGGDGAAGGGDAAQADGGGPRADAAPALDGRVPGDGAPPVGDGAPPVGDARPPVGDGAPPVIDAAPLVPDAAPADPCLQRVLRVGGVEIFGYEASRPDADAENAGVDGARACSRRGVLPWTNLTAAEARAACDASGFSLCAFDDWSGVCAGHGPDGPRLFPYGYAHRPGVCNDHLAGSGALEPTGDRPDCVTPDGIFDLSGNVWELVDEGEKSGASWKLNASTFRVDAARCDSRFVVPGAFFAEDLGFRCCRAAP